ncbi:MAG: DNA (cytosine-5-)-methyltransferase [Actinobacteria bacterium HGW-Actinobacteria-4]|nr:MAG: DNA (cytosine-5-)-methyltransferase [Actinobacteria bacterium HGW-Actinobacteria-4]
MGFSFVDLFAGIGGFHGALSALGGTGVLASEIDPKPAAVYRRMWGLEPAGDIRRLATDVQTNVPEHAVLVGGFPCQPFSKSGRQLGMTEIRGQMFNEILKILEVRKPPVVMFENVRNIAGPRQRPVWDAIVRGLREAGYRTPSEPCVYSPHLLSRDLGGAPQTRDRVYILGTYVGRDRALRETDVAPIIGRTPSNGWDPTTWDLEADVLEVDAAIRDPFLYSLSPDETAWIETWNDFLARTEGAALPGHPLWSQYWRADAIVDRRAPSWKQQFERQNMAFYARNRGAIDGWFQANPQVRAFPLSRQKFEWQAGDYPRDLTKCLIQLRPSGVRVKKPNYAPALVAMGQTPIVGSRMRRLTIRESARLQGFPDWFDFGDQRVALSYRQLGNAVHPGVVYLLLRQHILQDREDISASSRWGADLVRSAVAAPAALDPNHGVVRRMIAVGEASSPNGQSQGASLGPRRYVAEAKESDAHGVFDCSIGTNAQLVS